MKWLYLGAVGFASAFVPVVNIEVVLCSLALTDPASRFWTTSLVAAAGQMLGKWIWYELGRRIDRPSRRLSKRLIRIAAHPKFQTACAWCARSPRWVGGFILLSASVGIPPFAVVCVAAGAVKSKRLMFLTLGLTGRLLRFVVLTAIATGAHAS